MSDILMMHGFMPRALVAEELHVVSSNELTSFNEAKRSPSWRKAMMEEMDSIEEVTPGASSISHLVTSTSG
jgi:hypothetical protein